MISWLYIATNITTVTSNPVSILIHGQLLHLKLVVVTVVAVAAAVAVVRISMTVQGDWPIP
jgi:hypothetical protein